MFKDMGEIARLEWKLFTNYWYVYILVIVGLMIVLYAIENLIKKKWGD